VHIAVVHNKILHPHPTGEEKSILDSFSALQTKMPIPIQPRAYASSADVQAIFSSIVFFVISERNVER
jgi:hypothetical protein